MKTKTKLPPQQVVNWAKPQWQYAARGIGCRADWKGAHVYDTEVGLIIAYSQEHADDTAKQVLLDEEANKRELQQTEQLFDQE